MKNIEMHCHSTLSDGRNTPEEVINEAHRLWLDFLTLTDHDTIAPKDFQNALQQVWIDTCESVEISARNYDLDKSLHLVSYAKVFNSSLSDILGQSLAWKLDMKLGQLDLLVKDHGFIGNREGFRKFLQAKWRTLEGSNKYDLARYFARNIDNKVKMKHILWGLLIDNDVVNSFYKECFKREWTLYDQYGYEVADYEPSVETTIQEVVWKSWGLVSMAHPNVTFDNNKWGIAEFERTMWDYVEKWLNAVEINTMASMQWVQAILEVREKFDLILTFWSDCHMIWYDGRDGKHASIWVINPFILQSEGELQDLLWYWAYDRNFERFLDTLSL